MTFITPWHVGQRRRKKIWSWTKRLTGLTMNSGKGPTLSGRRTPNKWWTDFTRTHLQKGQHQYRKTSPQPRTNKLRYKNRRGCNCNKNRRDVNSVPNWDNRIRPITVRPRNLRWRHTRNFPSFGKGMNTEDRNSWSGRNRQLRRTLDCSWWSRLRTCSISYKRNWDSRSWSCLIWGSSISSICPFKELIFLSTVSKNMFLLLIR